MVASTQAKKTAPTNVRWDDVRVFLALYRARTLADAAACVGLDASTLSRRLTAIEEAVATRLFDRSRDGLAPTPAAEHLLAAAETMEAGHARFEREVSTFESAPEGVVRIATPPGLEAFLGPLVLRLYARHPGIRLELDTSVRVLDLTRREADIALRTVRPQGGDLVMTKVASTRWVPLVSPELARALRTVRDLNAVPWIAWGDDLANLGPARWLAKHAPRADVRLRTSQLGTQLTAAEAGLGAVLAPAPFARARRLAALRLGASVRSAREDLPKEDLWLVGHAALRDVPRVAAVWAFLTEEFAALESTAAT